jgi:hypothetical protein
MTSTGRVRMRDRTRDDASFGHQPPVIVWYCAHKPRHMMLRVFVSPDGWRLVGERLRLPLDQWLDRTGSTVTVDDLREGKAEAMNKRRVQGVDWLWPLDIDQWQNGRAFEVGCRRGIVVAAQVDWLADDARRARDTHKQVVRTIP